MSTPGEGQREASDCPFCGCEGYVEADSGGDGWLTGCNSGQVREDADQGCRFAAIGFWAQTREEALQLWNRRGPKEGEWRRAAIQARADLKAAPVDLGLPATAWVVWSNQANTMRWIDRLEAASIHNAGASVTEPASRALSIREVCELAEMGGIYDEFTDAASALTQMGQHIRELQAEIERLRAGADVEGPSESAEPGSLYRFVDSGEYDYNRQQPREGYFLTRAEMEERDRRASSTSPSAPAEPLEVGHEVKVHGVVTMGGFGYGAQPPFTARCTCGWSGVTQDYYPKAVNEGSAHVMAMLAGALPAVVCGECGGPVAMGSFCKRLHGTAREPLRALAWLASAARSHDATFAHEANINDCEKIVRAALSVSTSAPKRHWMEEAIMADDAANAALSAPKETSEPCHDDSEPRRGICFAAYPNCPACGERDVPRTTNYCGWCQRGATPEPAEPREETR